METAFEKFAAEFMTKLAQHPDATWVDVGFYWVTVYGPATGPGKWYYTSPRLFSMQLPTYTKIVDISIYPDEVVFYTQGQSFNYRRAS